jgi:hypothetical protein
VREAPGACLEAKLRRYVAARGLKLKHLAAGVAELSAIFTGRARFDPDYMRRPGLRRAYAVYYAPLGALKLAAILSELGPVAPALGGGDVVDVGGGPGTGLWGLRLAGRRPRRYTLVERVRECLEEVRLLETLDLQAPPVPVRWARRAPPGADLALQMNVLGEPEAPPALPEARTVVVVEPALKDQTQRLMARRDAWAAAGWRIVAPCPAVARCPMRARPELWCHAEIPRAPIPLVEELGRRAGLRPEDLKFSYVVLSREGPTLAERWAGLARLVSHRHAQNGKSWGWVCGVGDALTRAELLDRGRGPAVRDFARARRGDLFAPLELDARGRVGRAVRVARMSV